MGLFRNTLFRFYNIVPTCSATLLSGHRLSRTSRLVGLFSSFPSGYKAPLFEFRTLEVGKLEKQIVVCACYIHF